MLLAAVVVVYGNTLVNQFVLDDELYILRNAQVTDPSVHGLLSLSPFSDVFRPVTFTTLALNWALSGPETPSYHLFNLLLARRRDLAAFPAAAGFTWRFD